MANLAGVVEQLRKERDLAAMKVKQLDAALAALNGVSATSTRTGSHLSATTRARIAAAQRARWARVRARAQAKIGQKPNVVTIAKKRTMSPAVRRKIAAAQRARWAKMKTRKAA